MFCLLKFYVYCHKETKDGPLRRQSLNKWIMLKPIVSTSG